MPARSVSPWTGYISPATISPPRSWKWPLKYGIGHIVVDNLPELNMLIKIAGKKKVNILLRLNPGIDPHTHQYNTTGIVDSKFGLTRATWDEAVETALAAQNLNVDGLHFHLGSGLFEFEPYFKSMDVVLEYAAASSKNTVSRSRLLSIGGGFGVQYVLGCGAAALCVFRRGDYQAVYRPVP